jgi:hypothetical protein
VSAALAATTAGEKPVKTDRALFERIKKKSDSHTAFC